MRLNQLKMKARIFNIVLLAAIMTIAACKKSGSNNTENTDTNGNNPPPSSGIPTKQLPITENGKYQPTVSYIRWQ